jgi:hypothetical protein
METFSEANSQDELATVNQSTFKLEYQRPSKLHAYDFDGKLYCCSGRSIDFAVTPGHRMFIRKWSERERTLSSRFEFVKMRDLGWYAGLLASPKGFEGKYVKSIKIGNQEVNGNDFFKFLGIFLSDGWLRIRKTSDYGYCIGVCCFNDGYYKTIHDLLKRLPFDFKEQPTRKGYFTTHDKDLYNFLKPYSLIGSPKKYIPDFVKNASGSQIQAFLDFFRLGDGHKTKDGRVWYYTSSKQMADDLQELILKTGKNSSVVRRPPRNHVSIKLENREIKAENCHDAFVISVWRKSELSIDRKEQIFTRDYKGKVYCATVPNSTLMTRQNGKVLISGNCVGFATATGMKEYQEFLDYEKLVLLSPRFVYSECKKIDGMPGLEGTTIRAAMQVLKKLGVCQERFWPYKPHQKDKPKAGAFSNTKKFCVLTYARILNLNELRMSLATKGPCVIGVEVFEGMMETKTGLVPMPKKNENSLGGHAICVCGFDDKKKVIKFKNSWSDKWGEKGYGFLPYAYIERYMMDAWSSVDIEDPNPLTLASVLGYQKRAVA